MKEKKFDFNKMGMDEIKSERPFDFSGAAEKKDSQKETRADRKSVV